MKMGGGINALPAISKKWGGGVKNRLKQNGRETIPLPK